MPFKHPTKDPGIFYFKHDVIILNITMNCWLSILWWITNKEVQKLRILLRSWKLIPSGYIFILVKRRRRIIFSQNIFFLLIIWLESFDWLKNEWITLTFRWLKTSNPVEQRETLHLRTSVCRCFCRLRCL